MYDLEQAINDRCSIRMFLPDKPVPRELVDRVLELAIRAPSNSNVQLWHLRLVSGPAREQLDLPEEYVILCGLAIGYPDPTVPANNLHIGRNPIEHNVVFHDY